MEDQVSIDKLNLKSLKRKSVLITGGASGLGLKTAKAFAKAGAYVTIADIKPSEPIIKSFEKESLGIQYVHCDVTDWQQQVTAFKQALQITPARSLDVVACFAAIDEQEPLVDQVAAEPVSIDDIPSKPGTNELDVNLTGVWYSTKLALHYLRLASELQAKKKKSRSRSSSSENSDSATSDAGQPRESEKSLVLISSLAAYMGDVHNSLYVSSKHAVRGLFQAIQSEAQSRFKIRVNLIAPWALLTPMTLPVYQRMEELGIFHRIKEGIPDRTKATNGIKSDKNELDSPVTEVKDTEGEEKLGTEESQHTHHSETAPEPEPSASTQQSTAEPVEGVANERESSGLAPEVTPAESRAESNGNNMNDDAPTTTASEAISNVTDSATDRMDNEEVNATTTTSEPNPDESALVVATTVQESTDGGLTNGTAPTAEPVDGSTLNSTTDTASTTEITAADSSAPVPEKKTETDSKNGDGVVLEEKDHQTTLPKPSTLDVGEVEQIRYKELTFASVEDVVSIVLKCSTDYSISGQAFAVMPDGIFNLRDERDGEYGGRVSKKLWLLRKDAGDDID